MLTGVYGRYADAAGYQGETCTGYGKLPRQVHTAEGDWGAAEAGAAGACHCEVGIEGWEGAFRAVLEVCIASPM